MHSLALRACIGLYQGPAVDRECFVVKSCGGMRLCFEPLRGHSLAGASSLYWIVSGTCSRSGVFCREELWGNALVFRTAGRAFTRWRFELVLGRRRAFRGWNVFDR